MTGNWAGFRDAASHLVLPTITLAAYPAALITRMTRAAMLDVLGQDYIRTARTFGLSERLVLWRLALRNAMPTTLTVSGLSLAYLVTGSFFVEIVFNWPGHRAVLDERAAQPRLPRDHGDHATRRDHLPPHQPRRRPAAGASSIRGSGFRMSVSLDSPEQLPEAIPLDRAARRARSAACATTRGAHRSVADHAPRPRRASQRRCWRRTPTRGVVTQNVPARSRPERRASLRHRPPRPGRPQPGHVRRPPGDRRRARGRRPRGPDRRPARAWSPAIAAAGSTRR